MMIQTNLRLIRVSCYRIVLMLMPITGWAQNNSFALGSVFQDHMVVQQAKPFRLWGVAPAGTRVEALSSWNSRAMAETDASGRWSLSLDVPPAKQGDFTAHHLDIKYDGGSMRVSDLLIGDVWFCSGQSNMEMTMQAVPPWHKGVRDATSEIAQANYPALRLFKVLRETSEAVRDTLNGKWFRCSPESVAAFSGVAYYFGRKIISEINIPVGMVVSAFGGASCQAFIRRDVLESDPLLKEKYLNPYLANPAGKQPHLQPTLVYNAIIHPLMPMSIKGILWYQGESNAGETRLYDYLNAAMIKSWREEFNQGDLPFYFVQMTPYRWNKTNPAENGYARFRENQASVLKVPNTGMVCTMDVGDPDDIHPTNKKPVGERLAGVALKKTYGLEYIATGPVFQKMKITGSQIILHFDPKSLYGGLRTSDGQPPKHFFVAGADSVFRQVNATIMANGKKVRLNADGIQKPLAVRYAFTNAALTNLENFAGWPAFPFRTDHWEN